MGKMSEKEIKALEEKNKNRDQLRMLVGEDQDEDDIDFKGNKQDSRFKDLIRTNKEFALDPTHKDFHKTNSTAYAAKR